VVLSAISLPSYGTDTGTSLVELLEKCAAVAGIERIRLGSLDPDMLTPDAIQRLAAIDKLCPQFHLSLQSGCTATLRRMRRVYTAEQYAAVAENIRAAYGGRPVSFTTDCICGFPGETEEDFQTSCAFLEQIGFLKVHVFPYSRRSGTPAYDFPDQIPEKEKQARSRAMNAQAEAIRARVLAGYEGMEDEVLLETPLSETLFTGYTRLYVPVVVSAPGHKSGEIVRVRLGAYDGDRVRATLV
jgi:threonylcarbamoyladenosine tRNA methylthiotransferase MtaB